jgi:hypothetical protein
MKNYVSKGIILGIAITIFASLYAPEHEQFLQNIKARLSRPPILTLNGKMRKKIHSNNFRTSMAMYRRWLVQK